jgi:glutaredoxin
LRAGHYWPWISVYFEGITANKQGIDGQWPPWPPLNSRPGLSLRVFRNQRSLHTRLFGDRTERFIRGSLTFAGVLGGFVCYKQYGVKSLNEVNCQDIQSPEQNEGNITLYQFASCQFCNKVRTFLDYYGMEYKIVEVDPIFKKEIKFSEYRKVPIVVIQDIQVGHVTRTCSPFLFNCWSIDNR